MAKNLKLNIKNTQLAEALNIGKLKGKLKKSADSSSEKEELHVESVPAAGETPTPPEEEPRRVKARSKNAPPPKVEAEEPSSHPEPSEFLSAAERLETAQLEEQHTSKIARIKASLADTSSKEEEQKPNLPEEPLSTFAKEPPVAPSTAKEATQASSETPKTAEPSEKAPQIPAEIEKNSTKEQVKPTLPPQKAAPPPGIRKQEFTKAAPLPPKNEPQSPPYVKLGPTGRHVNDLARPKPPAPPQPDSKKGTQHPSKIETGTTSRQPQRGHAGGTAKEAPSPGTQQGLETGAASAEDEAANKKGKLKEFTDVKPLRKQSSNMRSFDSRDRQGLRDLEEDHWRKKRPSKHRYIPEDITIRPTNLKIRLPISVKDLAVEMKLKASQLIAKLFMQGLVLTLNDFLDDETTIQLLGHEFGCTIEIDKAEEQRIRITDKTIKQEVESTDPSLLIKRAPVVAFMGHVDHGKTSLIDAIRKSNRVAGEAGAITQHIGAFRCNTPVGDITILDTPGHEAFSAMRTRGAEVTDIVVLVVAGDEGLRQQTIEAIQQAKAANVTIVVAINKSDKPNFNAENVYQQLTTHELLAEAWGGSTITVNCSAVTGAGIPELLEMLALQADILELKANPASRARGTVIESEMHKGLGSKATVLVQNGTLRIGDAVVFGQLWGRLKTMHDERGNLLMEAGPSTPVEITGLSGLPEAGQEFIVVKNEREAREIAEARMEGQKSLNLQQKKKISIENLVQQATVQQKKILHLILRADVQGSLEALKTSLLNIQTTKVEVNIVFAGVGEVSESDIQLAAASQANIIGFHTAIEGHAESLIKQLGVKVYLHDVIYHAIDDVKRMMLELLDKIALEKDTGAAEVRATFRASQIGIIAGCMVTDGVITRNNKVRVIRDGEVVWKGGISSLKRVKEDVREVKKGFECGILLDNFSDITVGDIIQSYEVTYLTQEL